MQHPDKKNQLQDEHVLAALSAVVLALKEGRTGLPIGGVFGAGKLDLQQHSWLVCWSSIRALGSWWSQKKM